MRTSTLHEDTVALHEDIMTLHEDTMILHEDNITCCSCFWCCRRMRLYPVICSRITFSWMCSRCCCVTIDVVRIVAKLFAMASCSPPELPVDVCNNSDTHISKCHVMTCCTSCAHYTRHLRKLWTSLYFQKQQSINNNYISWNI